MKETTIGWIFMPVSFAECMVSLNWMSYIHRQTEAYRAAGLRISRENIQYTDNFLSIGILIFTMCGIFGLSLILKGNKKHPSNRCFFISYTSPPRQPMPSPLSQLRALLSCVRMKIALRHTVRRPSCRTAS